MNVLEIGNYVVPAYAGMILAEQGAQVVKWHDGKDPILGLNRGADLWAWVNHGKSLESRHPRELLDPAAFASGSAPDVVIENFRPATLARWGIDPAWVAADRGLVWVSMRPDVGDRSFDILAQARSWMEYAPWAPFWAGDTIGGLWVAFKALAMHSAGRPGHYEIFQATCMQKLVEGELVVDRPACPAGTIPWEVEPYRFEGGHATVRYKGDEYREPIRDRDWKIEHLRHREGRMTI
jgi:crotonobetainyl-CoA:carnitine CoA-transferase CaiB-like acyl-CoA transferase